MTTDKWSNYWTNEGASGEVFVNKDGGKHPYLASYWQVQFSGLDSGSVIIDLASGAGSIFSHLPEDHKFQLFGADLSQDALQLMRERLPTSQVIACSSAHLPFPGQSFDLVVSQFGVEYAGEDAFMQAAGLVAVKGRLAILCHYSGGYIDSKNQDQLAGAQMIVQTGFIEKARDLTIAAFQGGNFQEAQAKFIPAERQISGMVRQHQGGIHSHLYTGFRQLFERRKNFVASDITDWLEAMRIDVEKNIIRLTQMCDAASSEQRIKNLCRRISLQGLSKVGYSAFTTPDNKLPVAWSITAQRT